MNDVARVLELGDRLPVEWSGLLTRSAQALAAVQAGDGRLLRWFDLADGSGSVGDPAPGWQ